jgi:hypothetical protein
MEVKFHSVNGVREAAFYVTSLETWRFRTVQDISAIQGRGIVKMSPPFNRFNLGVFPKKISLTKGRYSIGILAWLPTNL